MMQAWSISQQTVNIEFMYATIYSQYNCIMYTYRLRFLVHQFLLFHKELGAIKCSSCPNFIKEQYRIFYYVPQNSVHGDYWSIELTKGNWFKCTPFVQTRHLNDIHVAVNGYTVIKMNKALDWVQKSAPICKLIPFLCFSVLESNFFVTILLSKRK